MGGENGQSVADEVHSLVWSWLASAIPPTQTFLFLFHDIATMSSCPSRGLFTAPQPQSLSQSSHHAGNPERQPSTRPEAVPPAAAYAALTSVHNWTARPQTTLLRHWRDLGTMHPTSFWCYFRPERANEPRQNGHAAPIWFRVRSEWLPSGSQSRHTEGEDVHCGCKLLLLLLTMSLVRW